MLHEEEKRGLKKKKSTETIYNVEIERKLVTEHNFERASYDLTKLAQIKEITTVEIVLDTIQSSLELALFGSKVEVAIINDQSPKIIEFYGDKNYTRKVHRGDSGCFKAIEKREIVVEVDHSQITTVYVPLIGPTLVHGVVEIHGLVTNELLNSTQTRRPVDAIRNMLTRQDYTFLQTARFWKLEKIATYAKIHQPNSSMVMSGRIQEIVYTKNGIPFFGGPRFNILWEDGKISTEITAGELLTIYQETPQSLGEITVLDDTVTDRLYQYCFKAGAFLESRKTEIFLFQLNSKLKFLQLNSVGIVEMILQSIPNIITDIKEIVFLGFNYRINEMKTLINFSPGNNKEKITTTGGTFTISAFDIAQSLMKGEFTEGTQSRRNRFKTRDGNEEDIHRIYSKHDPSSNFIWAGIELRVPEKFQWAKSSDFNRFFLIFHKKMLRNASAVRSSTTATATNSTGSRDSSPSRATPAITNNNNINNPNLLLPFDFDVFLGTTKQIEMKISLIWRLEQRKKGFRETIKQLEGILLENRNLSLKEIYDLFLNNIPQKWLRGDLYVGMLKSGAQVIDYVTCNESSKMLGKSLKRGEGISFDVVDSGKSLIFNQTDLDKKRQLSEGCVIGIMYGRKQYSGKLLQHRGHEKYDVRYDFDQKVEAGVDLSRIIPMNIAFRIKLFSPTKAKFPFIVVPIKNRNKCLGVLGVDNIDQECLIDTSLTNPTAAAAAAAAAGNATTVTIDEDLQTFLEQLGKILGSAIDIKLKKNALQSMYTVAKNQNAELKDLFTSAMEVIFACSCYLTGIIFNEYTPGTSTSNPGKLTLIDMKGTISAEVTNKLTNFDIKKYGKKLLQRVGTKGILLLCIIKPENEEEIEGKIYVIGMNCNAPILDVDYEFFNAFQKTFTGLLHNILTHKASGEYRARALKDIRQLCNQWISSSSSAVSSRSFTSSSNRQLFFNKFCEKIWKVYHAANLYCGILGMHANQIRYLLASNASEMAGKTLIRSNEQIVSFLAIDKDRPLCVLAGTPLANQLYHFGEKQSFQYPFVVVPIVADIDTVFGILGVDNSAGEVMTETAGQIDDLMGFYGTVGLSLGKVIRQFRSEDVKKLLIEIRRKCNNFTEGVIAIRKILLEYLPFANRVMDLSFRPYISKVIVKQEVVVYLQISELKLRTAVMTAYDTANASSVHHGIYRLLAMYRGHVIGEVRPVNSLTSNRSTKKQNQRNNQSEMSNAIQMMLKIIVPEGIASDNFKILFKLICTTNTAASNPGSSANNAVKSTGKSANPRGSSGHHGGGGGSRGIKNDQEISQTFLNLHYFYHSPLLSHRHTLYHIDTNPKPTSKYLEAEVAQFQMISKLEDAKQPVAVMLTSVAVKLDFSTNISKLKSDYQIFVIFLWNGQNIGRSEYISLDYLMNCESIDTFLTLPASYDNSAATTAATAAEGNNNITRTPVQLDLEIWSNSSKTKDDQLGKVTFNVPNLLSHLTTSREESSAAAGGGGTVGTSRGSKKLLFQPVQRSLDCLSFVTTLALQLTGKVITARDIEQEQIPYLLKTSEHSTQTNLIPLQLQKSIKNLDHFIQCELSVVQVRDLMLFERFNSMSTYFLIQLNNSEIGSTSICYDPLVPHWKDEYFRLLIPSGPEWEEYHLTLDLYGMIGNVTEAVLIGKCHLQSTLLAESVLSGLMKYTWFDLILYNEEGFELESQQRCYLPQVLISARILTIPKMLNPPPSHPHHPVWN